MYYNSMTANEKDSTSTIEEVKRRRAKASVKQQKGKYVRVLEGPFAFKLEDSHKIRIGVSIPPLPVLYMDELIKKGYFPNRSSCISHALVYFLTHLKEDIDIDKLMKEEVTAFYDFLWREGEAEDTAQ